MKNKTIYKKENIKQKKVVKEEKIVNYELIFIIIFSIIILLFSNKFLGTYFPLDFYGEETISLLTGIFYIFVSIYFLLVIPMIFVIEGKNKNLFVLIGIITLSILILNGYNITKNTNYIQKEIQNNIYIQKLEYIPTNLNSKYILPDNNKFKYCYNLELFNKETGNLEYFKLKCVKESEFKGTETLKEIVNLKREKIEEIIGEGTKPVNIQLKNN